MVSLIIMILNQILCGSLNFTPARFGLSKEGRYTWIPYVFYSYIIDKICYVKEGHTVYTKLGNGTETTYTYDKQRERLQVMNLTAAGAAVMINKYRYDAVDNILGITNVIDPAKAGGKSQLCGAFSHTYAYDELNRLITASGKAKSASYEMAMTFGRMSEPLTKVQKVDSMTTAKSYNFAYKYEDSNHPTAPTQIGHDHYTYDANGNPTLVTNDSTNTTREMYWDEDNRLIVLSDNDFCRSVGAKQQLLPPISHFCSIFVLE